MEEKLIDAVADQIETEINTGYFVTDPGHDPLRGGDWYWRELLGHPPSGHGYCRTCGPATSCLLGVYLEAVIETAIRRTLELTGPDKLWDTAAVAEHFGVSQARIRQLRQRADFPAPVHPRLNGGAVWHPEQILSFEKTWNRPSQGGRPRKQPRGQLAD